MARFQRAPTISSFKIFFWLFFFVQLLVSTRWIKKKKSLMRLRPPRDGEIKRKHAEKNTPRPIKADQRPGRLACQTPSQWFSDWCVGQLASRISMSRRRCPLVPRRGSHWASPCPPRTLAIGYKKSRGSGHLFRIRQRWRRRLQMRLAFSLASVSHRIAHSLVTRLNDGFAGCVSAHPHGDKPSVWV